jgi:hypothetical protein
MIERRDSVRWHGHNDAMNHLMTTEAPQDEGLRANGSRAHRQVPQELLKALGVLAHHVAFIQAERREDRNRLAVELVAADIDRVLAHVGMTRRVDDRGDEWAEFAGATVMWLGHRAELSRSTLRP